MSQLDQPKVSVVMAVHNSPTLLTETIESVLSQQGVDLEFVIVDDGSDRFTKDVLQQISDPRVKLFHQEKQGLTKALIKGCGESTSDYIARIDVGDKMMPNRLVNQSEVLKNKPSTALVCSPVKLVTREGYPLFDINYSQQSLQRGLTQPSKASGASPFHASVMFRRDLYHIAGGYRKEFYFAQDLDLWSRLIELGEISVTEKALTVGVFSANGLSARFAQEQNQLKEIVSQLISARHKGLDESALLKQAEKITENSGNEKPGNSFYGNYFIGRCLLKQRHHGAKTYLSRALKSRYWSIKTWWSLAHSLLYTKVSPTSS